jgi:hypothetical protein
MGVGTKEYWSENVRSEEKAAKELEALALSVARASS